MSAPLTGDEIAVLSARILGNVEVTDAGCWEYRGYRTQDGYGRIRFHGRHYIVTRIVAAQHLGLAVEDRPTFACHHCDNPPCVNPSHLFLGDNGSNQRDAVAKGRQVPPDTSRSHCAQGHDMAVTRRRWPSTGQPYCSVCRAIREAARPPRKRTAA